MVTDIIALHFCLDEALRNELNEIILNRHYLHLHMKEQILMEILKKHYSDLLKEFPTLGRDLKEVRQFRNTLAHGSFWLHSSDLGENMEGQVPIRRIKPDGTYETLIITQSKLDKMTKLSEEVLESLLGVYFHIYSIRQPDVFQNK